MSYPVKSLIIYKFLLRIIKNLLFQLFFFEILRVIQALESFMRNYILLAVIISLSDQKCFIKFNITVLIQGIIHIYVLAYLIIIPSRDY